jgi:hypothetical protein
MFLIERRRLLEHLEKIASSGEFRFEERRRERLTGESRSGAPAPPGGRHLHPHRRNADLFEEIASLLKGHRPEWIWVRSGGKPADTTRKPSRTPGGRMTIGANMRLPARSGETEYQRTTTP